MSNKKNNIVIKTELIEQHNEKAGTLYIVSTPIGNLQDMTLRSLEILKSVDLIACEDTRHTGTLLKHFEIKKPLVSYFQHSKLTKIEWLIEQLQAGKNIALVSDAGTPGISDPGQALVGKIRELSSTNEQILDKISILPIPGPSAMAAAVSVSGMVVKDFYFAGFLPKKKGRQTLFKKFLTLECPIVIYESANRLQRTLGDIRTYLGDSVEVFIAREITKMHEEYWRGNVVELLSDLDNHVIKGEVVLVVKS
ncbi:MAG: 16S rRNA (cytidine(1402)-2'-O)-methyltransferase [Candidatus Berkelbacteria bacterium]